MAIQYLNIAFQRGANSYVAYDSVFAERFYNKFLIGDVQTNKRYSKRSESCICQCLVLHTPGNMVVTVATVRLDGCAKARVEPCVRGIVQRLVVIVHSTIHARPYWFRGM